MSSPARQWSRGVNTENHPGLGSHDDVGHQPPQQGFASATWNTDLCLFMSQIFSIANRQRLPAETMHGSRANTPESIGKGV